jgi:protein O-mannosyl-transferase
LRERLLVVVAALAAFGFTAAGSFHFDDYALFSDPSITSPGGWLEVWRPLQTRPLTYFTFWLNYQLGGPGPIGFHVVNLGLHIVSAVLLLAILRRLLPPRVALVAALLFAAHPIQAEAVAYVFARATLLATLLVLASWWCWSEGRPWMALAWFAAALLAKEECAAFPLFLLALWLWGPETGKRLELARKSAIACMLALSLAAGLRVIWAAREIPSAGVGSGAGISPFSYLAMQGVAILRYLAMLLVPWGFTVDPDITVAPLWRAAAWAVVMVAALVALRFRRAAFWFLAGLILLAPSSSIFPAAGLAADRRMYLPMIAFGVCLAAWIQGWRREALALIFTLLVAVSIRYSWVWRSESSLWTETVERSPRKVRPRIHLSRALEPARALPLLEEARRIAPANPDVASEQGRVYLELGRPAEALAAFGRALALMPGDASAVNNRGVALQSLGQTEAAKADFERALKLDPCLFNARLNLQRLGTPPPRANCRFTPDQWAQLNNR